jgi:hypothetical protein
LLAPHFTQDNHARLLDRVRGMTKREIEVLVAELAPKPDVPARMRKLPERVVKPVAAFDFAAVRASTVGSTIAVPPSSAASTNAMAPSVAAPTASMVPLAAASTIAMPPSAAALANEDAPLASPALPAAELADRSFALQPLPARAVSTPLSPGRFKLELTLGQDAHDELLQLQALFRHQNPSGDLASIVERAISELLERTMKRRFAQTRASAKHLARSRDPRESAGDTQEQCDALGDAREEYGPILCGDEAAPSDTSREARDDGMPALMIPRDARAEDSVAVAGEHPASLHNSRYVPRKVLREVFARDGGQCAFVSPEGRRCSGREFLEVHHHVPFARGGKASVDNLRLSCRAHNLFLAELDYGRGFMREKVSEAERASHRGATAS